MSALESQLAKILPAEQTITAMVSGPTMMSRSEIMIAVPPIIPILIGETIYNLRAALDYLVYELFYLDTGTTHSGTKFLIEDFPQGWAAHLPHAGMKRKQLKKLWLHRLSASHQVALNKLQPFANGMWTATLRDLSNPDKHRTLVAVRASRHHAGGGHVIGGLGPTMVVIHVIATAAFQDGKPVLETLRLLQKEISDVIDVFNHDFPT